MMKLLCVVVVIAVIVGKSTASPAEFAKIIDECKTSEKASDVDVMNFKNRVKPVSMEQKCLKTCIMEKMELINNNQLNTDGCFKLGKMMPNSNEKIMQSVSEIVDECKVIQEKDRCEYGVKVSDCLMEAANKRQLNNVFM